VNLRRGDYEEMDQLVAAWQFDGTGGLHGRPTAEPRTPTLGSLRLPQRRSLDAARGRSVVCARCAGAWDHPHAVRSRPRWPRKISPCSSQCSGVARRAASRADSASRRCTPRVTRQPRRRSECGRTRRARGEGRPTFGLQALHRLPHGLSADAEVSSQFVFGQVLTRSQLTGNDHLGDSFVDCLSYWVCPIW